MPGERLALSAERGLGLDQGVPGDVPIGWPKSAIQAVKSSEPLALTYSVIWLTHGSDCRGLP